MGLAAAIRATLSAWLLCIAAGGSAAAVEGFYEAGDFAPFCAAHQRAAMAMLASDVIMNARRCPRAARLSAFGLVDAVCNALAKSPSAARMPAVGFMATTIEQAFPCTPVR